MPSLFCMNIYALIVLHEKEMYNAIGKIHVIGSFAIFGKCRIFFFLNVWVGQFIC